MERLTKRIGEDAVFHECSDICETCSCAECSSVQPMLDRLAEYEDTGLDPGEVVVAKHALMGRDVAKITEFESLSIDRLIELAKADNVNHPQHYTRGGVECIDAIEAATVGLSGGEAYCIGNAIKYLWRYKNKGGPEDLDKAMWYIMRVRRGYEPIPNDLTIGDKQ